MWWYARHLSYLFSDGMHLTLSGMIPSSWGCWGGGTKIFNILPVHDIPPPHQHPATEPQIRTNLARVEYNISPQLKLLYLFFLLRYCIPCKLILIYDKRGKLYEIISSTTALKLRGPVVSALATYRVNSIHCLSFNSVNTSLYGVIWLTARTPSAPHSGRV